MSFWNLSNGSRVESIDTMDMAGDMEPIPNNTDCLACIEEAKWDEYNADWYISIKWRILGPVEYANRVLWHKLKVNGMAGDKNPAQTADKAKRMLMAIDTNAGGQLQKIDRDPTNEELMGALMAKPMMIKVMVWEITKPDGSTNRGNWIGMVSPAKGATPAPTTRPVLAIPPPQAHTAFDPNNDLPF